QSEFSSWRIENNRIARNPIWLTRRAAAAAKTAARSGATYRTKAKKGTRKSRSRRAARAASTSTTSISRSICPQEPRRGGALFIGPQRGGGVRLFGGLFLDRRQFVAVH